MRCANPECRTESNYFRGGALGWIDDNLGEDAVVKGRFIWLCPACVQEFVIERWRPPGEQLRRRWAAEPALRARQAG
jgi:hypothetical protein